MAIIRELNSILRGGETNYRKALEREYESLMQDQVAGDNNGEDTDNMIINGDNRDIMVKLINQGYGGKISLIYSDPPFFTKAGYDAVVKVGGKNIKHNAYDDTWNRDMKKYLRMLTCRLLLMRDLLADDGLIWVHMDFHAVHYAKIIMDEIFGEENFVNEIIWQYKSGGSTKKRFSRKHDTILVYSKTKRYRFFPQKEKSYNRGLKPYHFKGVEEFQDEVGWYTVVNMKDVWQIDMVGRTSGERTGYATQKPEELMKRIIKASTDEGDLVADFFAGSGTLAAAAEDMNRSYIICDQSRLATETASARLTDKGSRFVLYEDKEDMRQRLRAFVKFKSIEDSFYEKKMIQVTIDHLRLNQLKQQVEEKYIDDIKELQKQDPAQLLLSWSVDYHYDGKVHRPDRIFTRRGGDIELSCDFIVMPGTDVSVRVTDIFGNHVFVYYTVL